MLSWPKHLYCASNLFTSAVETLRPAQHDVLLFSFVLSRLPHSLMSPWISAFRPRTLPLALASILTGAFLAAAAGQFNGPVVALAALTTILLQVLSNLANDYGDSQNGADSVHRQGPQRAVQSGAITPAQMKRGMWICGLLALASGLALLWVALGAAGLGLFLAFLALGLAAIWAAVNYTAGKNPYGYAGLGDISVFLFFGLVEIGRAHV